jgi:hypothetical protein
VSGNVSGRAAAAAKILDRGFGKPLQLSLTGAGQIRRASDLSDDELAAIIARVQPAPSAPVEPEAEHLPPNLKKMN